MLSQRVFVMTSEGRFNSVVGRQYVYDTLPGAPSEVWAAAEALALRSSRKNWKAFLALAAYSRRSDQTSDVPPEL